MQSVQRARSCVHRIQDVPENKKNVSHSRSKSEQVSLTCVVPLSKHRRNRTLIQSPSLRRETPEMGLVKSHRGRAETPKLSGLIYCGNRKLQKYPLGGWIFPCTACYAPTSNCKVVRITESRVDAYVCVECCHKYTESELPKKIATKRIRAMEV